MNQGCNLNRREDDFMYVHKARIVQDSTSCTQEFYTSLSIPTPTFRDPQACKEPHLGHPSCDHVERIWHSIHQRVLLLDRGEIHIPIVRICEFEFLRNVLFNVIQVLDNLIVRVFSLREVIALEVEEEEELKLIVYTEFSKNQITCHNGEIHFVGDDIVKEDDSRDIEYTKITVFSEDESIMCFCISCDIPKNQKQ